MVTRAKFVQVCTKAIQETRNQIAIKNQVSGYLKYHREIKENMYFNYCRLVMRENERQHGYDLSDQYKIIKQSKMGNCHELAEYLSVKIVKGLKKENVEAGVHIVSSQHVDHVYLNIEVLLKDEKYNSLWEVDAWDPRIIDVSTKPDGTIKNIQSLSYGTYPNLTHSITTREFKKREIGNRLFIPIKQPIAGRPQREGTPEKEVIKKHSEIYLDYTLKNAYKNGKLDSHGRVRLLQCKSRWQ